MFNFSFINVAGNLASSKGTLIGLYWQSFCAPHECIRGKNSMKFDICFDFSYI